MRWLLLAQDQSSCGSLRLLRPLVEWGWGISDPPLRPLPFAGPAVCSSSEDTRVFRKRGPTGWGLICALPMPDDIGGVGTVDGVATFKATTLLEIIPGQSPAHQD